VSRQRPKIGALQIAIILLATATAIIHLYLAFAILIPHMGKGGGAPFILNGIGYFVLLGALYLPLAVLDRWRSLVHWVFIGYTALTVVLWFAIGTRDTIAYIDKIIEVMLIVLLFLDSRQTA
jgi:hypothetical protein